MISYIYKFTCSTTNLVYIGFTFQKPNSRWRTHHRNAFNKKHASKFYNAMRKYGWDSFSKEIIYIGFDVEYTLNVMEPHFIREYDSYVNGYNSKLGGDAPMRGKKHTKESKELMSKQRSGEGHWAFGTVMLQSTRDAISESRQRFLATGGISGMSEHTHSDESKKKMSHAHTGLHQGSRNARAVHYTFIDPSGTEYTVHGYLDSFVAEHGLSKDMVRKFTNTGIIPPLNKAGFPKRAAITGWQVIRH